MKILSHLSEDLEKQHPVIISEDQWQQLLSECEIIREEETYFSGKIRLLKNHNQFLVQEKSTSHEIILRNMPGAEEADVFIDQRLEIYENMWNGCGCKVNYYE